MTGSSKQLQALHDFNTRKFKVRIADPEGSVIRPSQSVSAALGSRAQIRVPDRGSVEADRSRCRTREVAAPTDLSLSLSLSLCPLRDPEAAQATALRDDSPGDARGSEPGESRCPLALAETSRSDSSRWSCNRHDCTFDSCVCVSF